MLEKTKVLLRDPIWQGIGVIVAIFIFLASFPKSREAVLDIVLKAVRKQIASPLAQYSTILFILCLIGLLIFRHETKRVKAAHIFLLFFSVAGFTFSFLKPFNYVMPKDSTSISTRQEEEKGALEKRLSASEESIRQKATENIFLGKENEKFKTQIERQKQQIISYTNILSQKDNENITLKEERDKLAKDVQNQRQQFKMYSDTIPQKEKEISTLKGQLTDLSAEVIKLQSRVATLEKENQQLQAQKENLRNTSTPPRVSFELVGGKLFLIEGGKKREILTQAYTIIEYSQSKSGKKFAAMLSQRGDYFMMISNADHDLSYPSLFRFYNVSSYNPPKNLKWISDTVVRLYLWGSGTLQLDDTTLKGTGNYEFTFDEINSLVNYKKLDIGG